MSRSVFFLGNQKPGARAAKVIREKKDKFSLTYPEEDGDNDVWTGTEIPADGDGEVPGEEGQPAEEEGPHHHAQGHEGLVLLPPHRATHGAPLVRAWF